MWGQGVNVLKSTCKEDEWAAPALPLTAAALPAPHLQHVPRLQAHLSPRPHSGFCGSFNSRIFRVPNGEL